MFNNCMHACMLNNDSWLCNDSQYLIDAAIGFSHVSAKEKSTCAEAKNLSLKDLQARAESILQLDYCMEASVDKINIIKELTKYLERKCRACSSYKIILLHSCMVCYLEKEKGSGGTTETEKHVILNIPCQIAGIIIFIISSILNFIIIQLINDAIHGPIELSPLLYQIINTPEFHRLKDLRQLGTLITCMQL